MKKYDVVRITGWKWRDRTYGMWTEYVGGMGILIGKSMDGKWWLVLVDDDPQDGEWYHESHLKPTGSWVYEQDVLSLWNFHQPTGECSMAAKKKKAKTTKKSPFGKPKKNEEDFAFDMPEDMDEGGARGRIDDGEYPGKCVGIIKEKSKANNPMWTWTFVITKGPHAGRDFKLWTVTTEAALWKIQETLLALGIPAEAGTSGKFKKSDVIGVRCILVIEDDEYNDKPTSKLARILPDPKGAGTRAKVAGQFPPDDEDEEEEEYEEEEENEEEEDEEEYEEDEYEEDDEEDEEEEEEPEPPKKKTAKKSTRSKVAKTVKSKSVKVKTAKGKKGKK